MYRAIAEIRAKFDHFAPQKGRNGPFPFKNGLFLVYSTIAEIRAKFDHFGPQKGRWARNGLLLQHAPHLFRSQRRRQLEVGMNPAHAEAPKTPTDQEQADQGGHSGEGQRSPEVELKPPLSEQPKTFYPRNVGRAPTGPTPAGTPRQSSRPPADGEPLSAEEAARLQREDEHFRAWRRFEHRQSASQSDGSEQFKPTWAKAQADPAFRADLERGATRHEAFKRYKSRVRAAAKQHAAGPPPVSLKVSRGPAMQSQGGFHRRTVMNRLR